MTGEGIRNRLAGVFGKTSTLAEVNAQMEALRAELDASAEMERTLKSKGFLVIEDIFSGVYNGALETAKYPKGADELERETITAQSLAVMRAIDEVKKRITEKLNHKEKALQQYHELEAQKEELQRK